MSLQKVIRLRCFFSPVTSALTNSFIFALIAALPSVTHTAGAAPTNEVRLEKQGGTYTVPVVINGAIKLNFILDSGASDVLIPADVFLTLTRTGTVKPSDFLGSQTYSLADGSKLKGARFLIRELRVGSQVATDVVASVGPVSGDLLLGLSFLSRFGSVTLDNNRHILLLAGRSDIGSVSKPQTDDQSAMIVPANPGHPTVGDRESSVQPPSRPESARFRPTGCNSIIDKSTGLEWYLGPDFNMSWPDANQWVHQLTACGGVWGMPRVDHLRTLFNPDKTAGTGYYTRGRYWPAHIDPMFSRIGAGSWVWAGGSPDDQGAPAFNFNQGLGVRLSPTGGDYTVRVFAVRRAS
jgi:predicted aspartyl protease